MAMAAAIYEDKAHPLDMVESLASGRDWLIDRSCDDEVNMIVSGAYCDLHLSFNWRAELEGLHVACTFDMKVPQKRRDEVMKAISAINEQLFFGHFDLWRAEGSLMYRHSVLLSGGAQVSAAQVDGLIALALENTERFFPVFQFVIWAGKSADEAIAASLLETAGEA